MNVRASVGTLVVMEADSVRFCAIQDGATRFGNRTANSFCTNALSGCNKLHGGLELVYVNAPLAPWYYRGKNDIYVRGGETDVNQVTICAQFDKGLAIHAWF